MAEPEQQWVFARFRLEPANAMLWCDDKPVPLAPKPFALLCYLVEHAGRLATKDDLLDAVWGHRFVTESALKVCMSELRQALGDDSKTPRYIETAARRGYRFIAPVTLRSVPDAGPSSFPVRTRGAESGVQGDSALWVGRKMELGRLQALWEQARTGERRIVFVTGEPGIGKTTLLEMFLQRLAGQNFAVLRGRCIEHFGEGEAFLPLLEALEKHCRMPGGGGALGVVRHHGPTWLAQMTALMSLEERESLPRQVLGATRERMLREGCEVVEALSGLAPLIVIVENLHWSDFATLDLLSMLAQRHGPAAMLVVGTYRPDEVLRREHPVQAVKQNLQVHGLCTELATTALSSAEVADYLSGRLAGSPLPQTVLEWIARRTEGHPLFLVNLIDYLLAGGGLVQSESGWVLDAAHQGGIPLDLRQMIEQQIDRLPPDAQHLLRVGSAAGMEFCAALLAPLVQENVVAAEQACESLLEAGLFLTGAGSEEWPDGTVSGRYQFRHGFYRDVLYDRLSPALRIQVHRSLGERLEAAFAGQAGEIASVLALHFEQGRDFARAVHYLRSAAGNASRHFANPRALDYLRCAIRLCANIPEGAGTEVLLDLLHQSAAVQRSMDDMLGAIESLARMLATAREAGARDAEVKALMDMSRACLWVDRRRGLELAAEAVECSRGLDDALLASLAQGQAAGLNLYFLGWTDGDAQQSLQAMAMARQTGDARILNTRFAFQAMLELFRSDYRAAGAVADEGMRTAAELGDGYQFMLCQFFRVQALFLSGQWGELRRSLTEFLGMAEKNSNEFGARMFKLVSAALLIEAGDFGSASRHCEEVLGARGAGDNLTTRCGSLILLGQARLGLKDYSGARACFGEITRLVQAEGQVMDWMYFFPFHQGFAEYWLSQGEPDQAAEHAEELQQLAGRAPERTYLAISHDLLARIALEQGDVSEAQTRIVDGLKIVGTEDVPLAARRIYQTGAELYRRIGDPAQENQSRMQSRKIILDLADALDEGDPLRHAFVSVVRV
jgi:DNA-binding winged helix-turn-helix (wHTH) protein/tetratricopeptide (TPR) repeat protein